jgi:NADPH-dependent glutamate synthase beta subunit-like oxidoreductase
VTLEVDGKKTSIRYPMPKKMRIVVIMNNQTTNAANATQIVSGAGQAVQQEITPP